MHVTRLKHGIRIKPAISGMLFQRQFKLGKASPTNLITKYDIMGAGRFWRRTEHAVFVNVLIHTEQPAITPCDNNTKFAQREAAKGRIKGFAFTDTPSRNKPETLGRPVPALTEKNLSVSPANNEINRHQRCCINHRAKSHIVQEGNTHCRYR